MIILNLYLRINFIFSLTQLTKVYLFSISNKKLQKLSLLVIKIFGCQKLCMKYNYLII
jgi:hypothetical protein